MLRSGYEPGGKEEAITSVLYMFCNCMRKTVLKTIKCRTSVVKKVLYFHHMPYIGPIFVSKFPYIYPYIFAKDHLKPWSYNSD